MLIVIEGVDGSGKQTQSELLAKRLSDSGRRVKRLAFPNYESDTSALVKMYLGGRFGSNANDVNAYASSVFYAADRLGSYLSDWKSSCDGETVILCDRYTTSNAVHQSCKLEGEERDRYLDWLFDFEYNLLGLPKPDRVIFLDMPPALGETLMKGRANKITGKAERDIHERDAKYMQKSYEAALYAARRFGWSIINCADGDNIRTAQDINDEIFSLINNF